MLQDNSRRYMTFAGPTIISCKYYYIMLCDGALLKSLYKMAASLKDKRTPITTPPYQVPSVDVTPDQPIFSLVTTFKEPKDRFQGTNSVRLCSLAVRYDNPISTRFLAPIDCLKIPALFSQRHVCHAPSKQFLPLLSKNQFVGNLFEMKMYG
jgi:hypothetical protein